jgi:predicted peptidase
MKKILFTIFLAFSALHMSAYDFLRPVKDSIPNGYNFWVYTPIDYFYSQEHTPVIIFLHGASLCGRNLDRVRRYGPLDAIVKGREIEALTIVPQNPGGAWNPKKIMDVLDWVKRNYACDTTRVYVLGMSLGGYGTMDVCATYPDRIAAGMAFCGGSSLKDVSGLGKLPFWIIHGTADRAVPIKQSKVVVEKLKESGNDTRLLYDWWQGANHGAPARLFYLRKTYEWLFSHSLLDKDRPVNRDISIRYEDLRQVYDDVNRGNNTPEVIDGPSVIKSEGSEY